MLNPSLFNLVPAPLRQPTNVAILVSVGLHGAIAVGWPILPASSSKTVQPWQTVDLVQLTPAEQKRLPNLSKPQLALSPTPSKPSSLPALPSLPPLPAAELQAQLSAQENNLSVSGSPSIPPPPPLVNVPSLPAPDSYRAYYPPSSFYSIPPYSSLPAPSLYSNPPLPPAQSAYSNLSVLPPSPRLTPNWSEVPAPSPYSNLSNLPQPVNSFIAQPQNTLPAGVQQGLSKFDPVLPADLPDSWQPAPPAPAPQIAARTPVPPAQTPPQAASQDSNVLTVQQFRQAQQQQGAAGLLASPGQLARASSLLPAQQAQLAQLELQWQQADRNRAVASAAQAPPASPTPAAPPNVRPQLWAYYQQLQQQQQAERQLAAASAAQSVPASPAPVAQPEQVTAAARASLEEKERQIQQQAAATPAGSISERQEAMLAGVDAYTKWVGFLKEAHSDLQMVSPIPMRAPYPPEASSQQLEGKAVVGVLVGAGGEILDGPTLLMGTQHEVLNQAALNAVKGVPLKGTGQTVAYQFSFEFKPDSQTQKAPAPAQPAPAPAQPAPAPAPAQPAPAPAPAQPAPAPAQPAPPPEQPAPAPEKPAPAPAQPAPAPAQSAPAPEKPAPDTSEPAPSQPSQEQSPPASSQPAPAPSAPAEPQPAEPSPAPAQPTPEAQSSQP